ncbi:peroxide stress protein YaaA [Weissella paramesenteroides]
MQIIISPAKKMIVDEENFLPMSTPRYLQDTDQILQVMHTLSYADVQNLWHTSDKLTKENYQNLQHMDLQNPLTPAILSYSGIQYQYMAPSIFSSTALEYLQKTLWILSGFYGALRPFDGIVPYRLEMSAQLQVADNKNLYEFWGDKLYRAVHQQGPIINLASKEYSQAITPYLKTNDQFIDVVFAHFIDGKLKIKATLAKIARGEMVRFIVENQLTTVKQLKNFQSKTYTFDVTLSTTKRLVFVNK